MNSKEENSEAFVPITPKNSASRTSPFAIANGLEMRLSVSPATPFLVASLPNHTKMFELVHVVTSMEDFGEKEGGGAATQPSVNNPAVS